MSLDHLALDAITSTDLDRLIDQPEGPRLEFKEKSYEDDEAKGEFRKDVTALANMHGGHIVIGMAEKDGYATAFSPLTGDLGKAIETLENLIRDGIEPRITGIEMRAIPVQGGHVIVVRVPRSWNPPHRVKVKGVNRFYVRNTNGAHEASVEELRMLFTLSATVLDRVRAFRQERLAKIAAGETPVALSQGDGGLVLHIAPLSAFGLHDPVDLEKARNLRRKLEPIRPSSFEDRYTFDGLLFHRLGEPCPGYTQLFRNGCIEAVDMQLTYALSFERGTAFHAPRVLNRLSLSIPNYLDALTSLEILPPVVLMLTLTGTRGIRPITTTEQEYDTFDLPQPLREPALLLPEVIIERSGTAADHMRALRPVFDALWNAGNAARCPAYDDDGNWIGLPG